MTIKVCNLTFLMKYGDYTIKMKLETSPPQRHGGINHLIQSMSALCLVSLCLEGGNPIGRLVTILNLRVFSLTLTINLSLKILNFNTPYRKFYLRNLKLQLYCLMAHKMYGSK